MVRLGGPVGRSGSSPGYSPPPFSEVRAVEASGPVVRVGALVGCEDVGAGVDVGGVVGVDVGGRDEVGGGAGDELGGGAGDVVGGVVGVGVGDDVGAGVLVGSEGGDSLETGGSGGGGGAGSRAPVEPVRAGVELGGAGAGSCSAGGGSSAGAFSELVAEVVEGGVIRASGSASFSCREPSDTAAITAKPVEIRTPAPASAATRRGRAPGSSRCIGSIDVPPVRSAGEPASSRGPSWAAAIRESR